MLVTNPNTSLPLNIRNSGYFSTVNVARLNVTANQANVFDGTFRNLFVGNIFSTGTISGSGMNNISVNSGANVTFLNQNNGPVASSNAIIDNEIVNTNSQAGYIAGIQGGTAWIWGLNASDGTYQLCQGRSFGVNEIMKSDSSTLNTNYPNQCRFESFSTSTQSSVTGDTTNATVIFNIAPINIGGNYSTGTGIFRCPINGDYVFDTTVSLTNVATGTSHTSMLAQFSITGTQYTLQLGNPSFMADSSLNLTVGGHLGPITLIAGTLVQVQVQINGASKTVNFGGDANHTSKFAGYLIG